MPNINSDVPLVFLSTAAYLVLSRLTTRFNKLNPQNKVRRFSYNFFTLTTNHRGITRVLYPIEGLLGLCMEKQYYAVCYVFFFSFNRISSILRTFYFRPLYRRSITYLRILRGN